jgi:hypothetical protein
MVLERGLPASVGKVVVEPAEWSSPGESRPGDSGSA